MAPPAVLPVLIDLLAREKGVDAARVQPGARLLDLGLDSVAAMDLVVHVEQAFDLAIPGEDLQELETVGDVAAYLERRLAAR